MNKVYSIMVLAAMALFAVAPGIVAQTPVESTMGMVQKIFYYHVPSAMVMFVAASICGVASALYLFRARPGADRLAAAAAELTVVFGLIVLVTGPLWARKSWGVWWQWDARLTSTLLMWMIFVACLMVRRFGGPGAEKLSAAMALFGMANVPFVYISVNIWRTLHSQAAGRDARAVLVLRGVVHDAVRAAAGAAPEARGAACRRRTALPAHRPRVSSGKGKLPCREC
jgi:heme exporter protein C